LRRYSPVVRDQESQRLMSASATSSNSPCFSSHATSRW
jgi:hypothetical protein